jgi:hypothetical protein
MCLVSPFSFPPSLIVVRPTFAPVPGSCFIPSLNHPRALKKKHPHIDRLYQHLISDEILYHNPNTTRIVNIFSVLYHHFGSCPAFGFSRVGPSAVRVRSGYSRTSSILTQIIVLDGPLVAYCGSLYFFSALHDVCERVFLMSLDAQQRYSHCFLDGLHHPIISYRQNASRSNFLGLEFFPLFLGFPIGSFFVFFFFRLISGEAGFNSHLVYGQFVQDNLALSRLLVLLDAFGMPGVVYLLHLSHSTTPAPTILQCVVD